MTVEMISGSVRDLTQSLRDYPSGSCSKSNAKNHGWNAVWLTRPRTAEEQAAADAAEEPMDLPGEWMLIDAKWGSGRLGVDGFVQQFDPYWFGFLPEHGALDHHPTVTLREGTRVKTSGLKNHKQLNGKVGTCRVLQKSGKWSVELDGEDARVRFMPCHLFLAKDSWQLLSNPVSFSDFAAAPAFDTSSFFSLGLSLPAPKQPAPADDAGADDGEPQDDKPDAAEAVAKPPDPPPVGELQPDEAGQAKAQILVPPGVEVSARLAHGASCPVVDVGRGDGEEVPASAARLVEVIAASADVWPAPEPPQPAAEGEAAEEPVAPAPPGEVELRIFASLSGQDPVHVLTYFVVPKPEAQAAET